MLEALLVAMSTGGEVANALVCKTSIRGFNPHPVLQFISFSANGIVFYRVNVESGRFHRNMQIPYVSATSVLSVYVVCRVYLMSASRHTGNRMGPEEVTRVASLRQLLEFERHKLHEFRRQQITERTLPNGHPEQFAPDIEICETMIRLWTARLALPSLQPEA